MRISLYRDNDPDDLIRKTKDPDKDVQLDAIRKLGRFKDPCAIPALVAMMDYVKKNELQSDAADSLAEIGAPAVPALIKLLMHNDKYARKYAADALRRSGDRRAVHALRDAADNDRDTEVRMAATGALRSIEERCPPHQDELLVLPRHDY